jgi:tetratricopeptide (TPR) repeat protein
VTTFARLPILSVACLLLTGPFPSVRAEFRSVTATGEHRLGPHDPRADAIRLALLDGWRRVRETAVRQLETAPEVARLSPTQEEIQALVMGLVESQPDRPKSLTEGGRPVLRIALGGQVETGAAAEMVRRLRENESARVELLRCWDLLRRAEEAAVAASRELEGLVDATKVTAAVESRRQALDQAEAQTMLAKAWASVIGEDPQFLDGDSTPDARRLAKGLVAQVLDRDPDNVSSHRLNGILFYEEGRPAAAVASLRKAIQLNPTYAEAHADLGVVLARQGDLPAGIEELRAAIALKPSYADARADLATLLYWGGDLEDAIGEAREAVRLKPNLAEAHATLGILLGARGNTEGAMAACREALRLKPGLPAGHLCLGTTFDVAGSRAEAVQEYRAFLKEVPVTSDFQQTTSQIRKRLAYLDPPPSGCARPDRHAGRRDAPEGGRAVDAGLAALLGLPAIVTLRRRFRGRSGEKASP